MDRAQIVAALNVALEELRTLESGSEIDSAAHVRCINAVDSLRGQLDAADAINRPQITPEAPAQTEPRDAFEEFAASGAIGEIASGKRGVFNLKRSLNLRDVWIGGEEGGLGIALSDVKPEIGYKPSQTPTLLNLLPVVPTTEDSLTKYVETGFTNNADTVARRNDGNTDFGSAVESDIDIEEVIFNTVRYAHFVRAHRDSLADRAQLEDAIRRRIPWGINLKIESDLVRSTDRSGAVKSLAQTGSGRAQSFEYENGGTGAAKIDAVLEAATLAGDAFIPATVAVFNAHDLKEILLAKASTGQYLLGGPLVAQFQDLWGLTPVVNYSLPYGKILVGGTAYTTVYLRQGTEVEVTDVVDDDKIKFAARILGNNRLTVVNERPEAWVTVTEAAEES